MPLIQGTISSLPTTRIADGTVSNFLQGRQGEIAVSELHGKQYTNNINGLVWHGNVNAVTLPVNAANLVSVFSLINPVGSVRNLELIHLDVAAVLATTVVDGVSWVQQSIRGGSVLPTTFTAGVAQPGLVGGPGSQSGLFCTAATHIGTPVVLTSANAYFGAVTSTVANAIHYDYDGTIILAPGSIISLVVSTTAWTASGFAAHVSWSEGPLNG
jgi:hypothetical protein